MRCCQTAGFAALALAALSCSILAPPTQPVPEIPGSPTGNTIPLPVELPTATAPAERADLPQEAILILEPGPGCILIRPIHIAGMADPAWEQTLSVELLSEDGGELSRTIAVIAADLGERGPFSVDLPFTVTEMQKGFLRVFHSSPRDGGILHLASVGVTLAPGAPEKVTEQEPHREDLVILVPKPGASIQGGTMRVEGFGIASFEQTLLVEVRATDGEVLASQPVIVDAPEWGMPGPFETDIPYAMTSAGAGRVVVRDISPAFGGDIHLASVEVALGP